MSRQDSDPGFNLLTSRLTGVFRSLGLAFGLAVLVALALPFFARAGSQDKHMAEELWRKLQTAKYRKNWATVPGKGTLYRGQPPHGAFLSTYLNPKAVEGMKAKTGNMPDGAIIVKENYKPDKTLAAVTVMYKEDGYDPKHKDWFWTKFKPDGGVLAAGKPAGCISCHGSVRSNDYVFTFPIAFIRP